MGKAMQSRKKMWRAGNYKGCLPGSQRQMSKATHRHVGKIVPKLHRAETQAIIQQEIKMCL